jgi:hypothetical protein
VKNGVDNQTFLLLCLVLIIIILHICIDVNRKILKKFARRREDAEEEKASRNSELKKFVNSFARESFVYFVHRLAYVGVRPYGLMCKKGRLPLHVNGQARGLFAIIENLIY